MKQILKINEYLNVVNGFRQKGTRSNDYIQQSAAELISSGKLFYACSRSNAFFFVKKPIGQRIYYYINDVNEAFDFGNDTALVTEILFRGNIPQEEIGFFLRNGFQENLIRDQYSGVYKDLELPELPSQNVVVGNAISLEQVETACNLFNFSFDSLSGDFIPSDEYVDILNNKQLLVASDRQSGAFLGALHQVKEGVINVIGHVAVVESARGKGVGKSLVNEFVTRNMESEKTRYQLWVQRQNEAAVSMYQKFGFKFTNKSTISLIKQR